MLRKPQEEKWPMMSKAKERVKYWELAIGYAWMNWPMLFV